MPKKIIHIGANKTGSTTLQRHLFSKSSQIAYLGEDCWNYIQIKDILNSLCIDDDMYYKNEEDNKLLAQKYFNDINR